jgi:hypothetical protein
MHYMVVEKKAGFRHSLFMRLIALMLVAAACAQPGTQLVPKHTTDSASYVVRLGQDTMYVQWVTLKGNDVAFRVVERIPRVRSIVGKGKLNSDGTIASLERFAYIPNAPDTSPVEHVVIREIGDSTIFEMHARNETNRYATHGTSPLVVGAYNGMAFPLYGHFAPKVGDSLMRVHIGHYWGDRPLTIKRISRDSVLLTSRHLGRTTIEVNPDGTSNGFDASKGSLNTIGARVAWLPYDSVLNAFVDAERKRGAAGLASPRDTARGSVGGATVMVDYGRPSKRGRVIFGGIIPWNEVWRAGANDATQIMTSRDLQIGNNLLPAGRYTLWIIPTPTAWTLIVNNETDQWGTDYKQSFDRFRIPLALSTLTTPVEKFTISIDPSDSGGVIRFRWDTTEASVPFTVR